jgi:hypothetical protein
MPVLVNATNIIPILVGNEKTVSFRLNPVSYFCGLCRNPEYRMFYRSSANYKIFVNGRRRTKKTAKFMSRVAFSTQWKGLTRIKPYIPPLERRNEPRRALALYFSLPVIARIMPDKQNSPFSVLRRAGCLGLQR